MTIKQRLTFAKNVAEVARVEELDIWTAWTVVSDKKWKEAQPDEQRLFLQVWHDIRGENDDYEEEAI